MKVIAYNEATDERFVSPAAICAYCGRTAITDPELDLTERSIDTICETCSVLEACGPPQHWAFGSVVRYVRRNRAWFLEGVTRDGMLFLIGRLTRKPEPLSRPETGDTDRGASWNGTFIRCGEPFSRRQTEARIPTECGYCGTLVEEHPYTEVYTIPMCDRCRVVERETPQLEMPRWDIYHVQRAGRWYLEYVHHATGRDGVFGETAHPPADWGAPPGIHAEDDGWWYWDADFVGCSGPQRTLWRVK